MITAVVLAAGASSRMGTQKLLLPLAGEPIVRRTVTEVCAAGFDDVLVVVGREAGAVRAALADLPCRFVLNPDYESGMGSSFRAAVAHLDASEAALIALADQPFVTRVEYRAFREAYDRYAPAIITSRFGSVTAPPHLFARELYGELARLQEGARPVLVRHAARSMTIAFPEILLVDIDSPDDYARAQSLATVVPAADPPPDVVVREAARDAHAIEAVPTSISAFVDWFEIGPVHEPVPITSVAELEQTFGRAHPQSEASHAVRLFFANGGRDALIVRVPPDGARDEEERDRPLVSASALIGSKADRTGLYALLAADVFNLLCLPAVRALSDTDASAVYDAADALCRACGAFLIVDLPLSGAEPAIVETRSANAAVYVPSIVVDDPAAPGTRRTLGASGAVAGVYASTDRARGVWKAPAGLSASLRGVAALSETLTGRRVDELTRAGLNPLITLPERGPLVWGARTLAHASGNDADWKYVPVRRLALLLEASIQRGTRWTVPESKDEPLFAAVRRSAGAFLESLWRQGAFAGRTRQEAYFVTCDATNNLPGTDVLAIEVGFAPLRPAEFVVLRFHHAGDDWP